LSVVVPRAQDGDEEAFACLFRAVQPALLGYLRVIAPSAAEDVAGETWPKVGEHAPVVVGGCGVGRATRGN
jgi:DNA-directed RNA polymerase specialized sigma24 family protein